MPITTEDVGYLQGLLRAFKEAEVRDQLIFFTDQLRQEIVGELSAIVDRATGSESVVAQPSQGSGSTLQSFIDAKIRKELEGGEVGNKTPDDLREQFVNAAEEMKRQMAQADETRQAYRQIVEDLKTIFAPVVSDESPTSAPTT